MSMWGLLGHREAQASWSEGVVGEQGSPSLAPAVSLRPPPAPAWSTSLVSRSVSLWPLRTRRAGGSGSIECPLPGPGLLPGVTSACSEVRVCLISGGHVSAPGHRWWPGSGHGALGPPASATEPTSPCTGSPPPDAKLPGPPPITQGLGATHPARAVLAAPPQEWVMGEMVGALLGHSPSCFYL